MKVRWKTVERALSMICCLAMLLPAIPTAGATDSGVNEDLMYQPSSACGTYLGKNADGVYEFEITIPDDRENQPKPLVLSSYYATEKISNSVPEQSGKAVIATRAGYFYGCYPGTADISYSVYQTGEVPKLKAVVHVTVLAQEDYDARMDSASTVKDCRGIPGQRHHWYYDWTLPTCEREGNRRRHCSVCKEEEILETFSTTGHSFRVTVKAPTQTRDGERTYTCSNCGYKHTETIAALGGTTAADPSGAGQPGGTGSCANGHSWSEARTVEKANCVREGSFERTCKVCGETQTGRIPQTDHSWVNKTEAVTAEKEGREYRVCSVCGREETIRILPKTGSAISPCANGHTYVSEVTRAPTVAMAGIRTYTCTRCGDCYTESIPATGSIPAAEPMPGASGMARSERGVPLTRRADGNYELFWTDGFIIRNGETREVVKDTRKLKVTTYSPSFQELSVREIPIEMDEIGNVYFGQDYNFLVFGQDNFEESRTKEVLRIVKYSKGWERLGAAALTDANTIDVIGQHGNMSFAEANGMLYIHSGHAMFKSSDGLNHQANMTFSIRVSDMTVTDKRVAVSNNSTGYVSHSLANDIIVDREGRIVTLDTGDAHPNGALLYRYGQRAGEEKFQGKAGERNIFVTWPGPRADIRTGAATSALAETSQGYLMAYEDSRKGAAYDFTKDSCSLYLAFTPKNSFNKESTEIRMVDAHTNGAPESALYSYLVPTSPEDGYLLWYTRAKTNTGYYGDYTLYYTTYQSDGTVGTTKKLDNVPMPYNGPINVDGKVVWAGDTEDKEGLRFCVLDQNGARVTYATGELANSNGTNPTEPEKPTNPAQPEKPGTVKTANPTNDKLTVNGVLQNPTVYKIGGSNYFKIRDVAAVLNGTEKQFSVGYSGGKVTATSGQPYETTGKELKGAPSSSKTATHSNDTILINGQEASLTVYKIGGSNYFKLRDLGKALNFYVGWTAGKGVYIETDKPYSE